VTGAGALVNVALNIWLVPLYGMVGAAIATLAAYVVLFIGMTLYAQHIYPVHYQWRRIVICVGVGVGLTVAARVPDLPLAPSFLLVLAYPLCSRCRVHRAERLRGSCQLRWGSLAWRPTCPCAATSAQLCSSRSDWADELGARNLFRSLVDAGSRDCAVPRSVDRRRQQRAITWLSPLVLGW
jgi:hypothetical protein